MEQQQHRAHASLLGRHLDLATYISCTWPLTEPIRVGITPLGTYPPQVGSRERARIRFIQHRTSRRTWACRGRARMPASCGAVAGEHPRVSGTAGTVGICLARSRSQNVFRARRPRRLARDRVGVRLSISFRAHATRHGRGRVCSRSERREISVGASTHDPTGSPRDPQKVSGGDAHPRARPRHTPTHVPTHAPHGPHARAHARPTHAPTRTRPQTRAHKHAPTNTRPRPRAHAHVPTHGYVAGPHTC